MSRVGIDATGCSVLKCQVHLIGTFGRHDFSQLQCTVVGDHGGRLVSILHVDGKSIEVVSVAFIDIRLDTFFDDRLDGQDDAFVPSFHWNPQLHPLARIETPGNESAIVFGVSIKRNLIGESQVKSKSSRGLVHLIRKVKQLQIFDHIRLSPADDN
jgi:hypothetical protein